MFFDMILKNFFLQKYEYDIRNIEIFELIVEF